MARKKCAVEQLDVSNQRKPTVFKRIIGKQENLMEKNEETAKHFK